MTHGHDQNVAFLCVSFNMGEYLGCEKVMVAFPDIPSELPKRIAYAASFNCKERATLKDALANDPQAESVIDSFFCNALVREIGSDPYIESRRKLVFRQFNSFIAHRLYTRLKEASILGTDEWLKEIAEYYEYEDDFTNFYLEGCCALAFQSNGINVKMKPYDSGGPDLQVSTGYLSFDVEISRFISETSNVSLPASGNYKILDRSQKFWSKIEGKARQLKEDKDGIVVLYSNEKRINHTEFRKITEYISCFGEKLCAVIFSDRTGSVKILCNPHARIPVQQLSTNLKRMEYAILNLQRNYEFQWVYDLRELCD